VNGISPKNVWLGATIVNQEEANRDIPKLLVVPAAKRFLSMEPLLGQVDLTRVYGIPHCAPFNALRPVGCAQHADGFCLGDCKWRFRGIDWVIVGGESGAGARPMHPDWARSLRDLCAAAGVAFLFKQWGEYGFRADLREDVMRESDGPEAPLIDMPAWMQRVGKRAAGRELDGVTHDGFPGEQHV
jgi:protein gp37